MANNFSDKRPSRRKFLAGAAALGTGATTAGSLSSSDDDPLITEVQEWAQITGDGVDATPMDFQLNLKKTLFGEMLAG